MTGINASSRPRLSDHLNWTTHSMNGWMLCRYSSLHPDEVCVPVCEDESVTFMRTSNVFAAKWKHYFNSGSRLWKKSVRSIIPTVDCEMLYVTYKAVPNSDCAEDLFCAWPAYLFIPADVRMKITRPGQGDYIMRESNSWCLRTQPDFHFHMQPIASPGPDRPGGSNPPSRTWTPTPVGSAQQGHHRNTRDALRGVPRRLRTGSRR